MHLTSPPEREHAIWIEIVVVVHLGDKSASSNSST